CLLLSQEPVSSAVKSVTSPKSAHNPKDCATTVARPATSPPLAQSQSKPPRSNATTVVKLATSSPTSPPPEKVPSATPVVSLATSPETAPVLAKVTPRSGQREPPEVVRLPLATSAVVQTTLRVTARPPQVLLSPSATLVVRLVTSPRSAHPHLPPHLPVRLVTSVPRPVTSPVTAQKTKSKSCAG
ncbi:hypothetical protein BABINDRAFT_48769, partial [Babjeviella inositovora NRRL Y-12698]